MSVISTSQIFDLLVGIDSPTGMCYKAPNPGAHVAMVNSLDNVPVNTFHRIAGYCMTKDMFFEEDDQEWIKQHPATCYVIFMLICKTSEWGKIPANVEPRQFFHNMWLWLKDSFE